VLLLALAVASALRGETLTVATYNVENYVAANRMTEAGYRKDYPKPEVQKAALRAVIRGLDADVLVLQEMGGPAYFEEFRRDLALEGIVYPHAELVVANDPDRHLAVLSRWAFAAVRLHTTLEFSYFGATEKVKRGMLEVRLATAAGEVTLFGLHLKSRYTDREDDPRSAIRRLGEATAIRDEVLRRFPEPALARFAIVGDFNDDRASRTLRRIATRGKTKVAKLLSIADSRGETWTHAYRKEDSYSRVDHVLVSAALRAAVRGGAGRIYDGEGAREASDHRPVVVTFEFGDDAK
jgi:endonuclease/exonuclease/phosphatase family metal-dependent hydrolase